MTKIPGFYALFTAVLMALSVASAAETSTTKYFCFKEIKDGELVERLEFSQKETCDDDETGFVYWFNETVPSQVRDNMTDAYGYVSGWLGSNMASVVLKSDIAFAGHTESDCIGSPDGFKGKYLELNEGRSISSEDGKRYTISGLCYESIDDGDGIGFVSIIHGSSGGISNVKFSDVYFSLTGDGSYAGVVSLDFEYYSNSIRNIEIEDSYFKADYAGAVFGYAKNYSGSIENVAVKNVTVDGYHHAGAVVGFAEEGSMTLNNVAVIESVVNGQINAGGLVGFTDGSIAITKSYYQGSVSSKSIAGGILGYISGDGSVNINNTFSKGPISGGAIQGSSAEGYIVGSIDAPLSYSSYVTLYNNYHFGEDTVEKGVGGDRFYADGFNWYQGYSYGDANVYANVRNAYGSLTVTGPLGYYKNEVLDCASGCAGAIPFYYVDFFAGELDEPLKRHANGIALEADMKSGLFAALLNYNLESKGEAALWVHDEDFNDGLPSCVNMTKTPNHLVVVQAKGLSDEQKTALGLVNSYVQFITSENSEYYNTDVKASGFFTSDSAGKLSSGDSTKIANIKKAVGTGAMLVNDSNGYEVSLSSAINSSLVGQVITSSTYDIVYQYCVTVNSCYDLDNLPDDVTLGFMTPKIDQFTDAADAPIQLIPNIFRYDRMNEKGLKFKVALYGNNDEILYGLSDTSPDGTDIWSFQDLAAKIRKSSIEGDVKKIVLSYSEPSNIYGEFPEIEIENPKKFDFGISIYGYNQASSMVEVIESSASEMSTSGKAVYGAAVKPKEIVSKLGYSFDGGYYAVYQYSAMLPNGNECPTNDTTRVDTSETTLYFGMVENLMKKMKECGTVEWTVKADTAEPVVLDNVKAATHAAKKLYENSTITEKLALIPKYSLTNYNVTFDMHLPTEYATDKSTIFVGRSGNEASASYTVEGPAFPKIYTTTCPTFIAWSPASDVSEIQYYFNNNYAGMNEQYIRIARDSSNLIADTNTTAFGYWNNNCTTIDASKILPLNYAIALDGTEDLSDDPLVTLTLKQNTFDGKIEHAMSSVEDSNNPGKYIHQTILPVADDTLTFVVNFGMKSGYAIKELEFVKVDSASPAVTPVSTNETVDFELHTLNFGTNDTTLVVNTRTYSSMTLNVNVVLVNYTVSFDISSLENETVVLGKNWAASMENMNVATNSEFPRAYVLRSTENGVRYDPVKWCTEDETCDESLTSNLLKHVSGSEFTLSSVAEGGSPANMVYVKAYDGDTELMDASDYHGSIVLSQVANENLTFEQTSELYKTTLYIGEGNGLTQDVYSHCLYVPSERVADDTLTFKVSLAPASGYTMSIEKVAFQWQDPTGGDPIEPPDGFGYNEEDSTLVIATRSMDKGEIKVKYTPVGPFYVTYDLNTPSTSSKNLYFPIDAKANDSLKFSETDNSVELWRPARTDFMCFDGWSVKDPATEVIDVDDKITTLFAGYAGANLSLDSEFPTKLFANWSSCVDGPETKITIANGNAKTVLKLTQTFDETEYEHVLDDQGVVLARGIYHLDIDTANSEVAFGYKKGDVTAKHQVTNSDGSDTEPEEEELSGSFIEVMSLDDNQAKPSPNTVYTLTMETPVRELNWVFVVDSSENVFYGEDWVKEKTLSVVSEDLSVPLGLYRADAEFLGWSPSSSMGLYFTDVESLLTALAKVAPLLDTIETENGIKVHDYYKLFAVWDTEVTPEKFSFRTSEHVEFMVYQILGSDTVAVAEVRASKDLEIPRMSGMQLGIFYTDASLTDTIIGKNVYGEEVFRIQNGEILTVADNQPDVVLSVKGAYKSNDFVFTFDEGNVWWDGVFYANKFIVSEDIRDRLYDDVEYHGLGHRFPTWSYTSDKCLEGWSVEPGIGDVYVELNDRLLKELEMVDPDWLTTQRATLYARWTDDVKNCAENFVRVKVEQEHGSIALVERKPPVLDQGRMTSASYTVHEVNDDGTIVLPADLSLYGCPEYATLCRSLADSAVVWAVMANPDSDYELNEVTVLLGNAFVKAVHPVYQSADWDDSDNWFNNMLPDMLPGSLENMTLKADFGKAFGTSASFALVSLLQSGNGGKAVQLNYSTKAFAGNGFAAVRVQIVDTVSGEIVAETQDSIGSDSYGSVVIRLKRSGHYEAVVSLDGVKSEAFRQKFTVENTIASVGKEGWQMLSLSAVDTSAIKWETGDPIFYWWDEYGTGEFWQYKQFNRGDSVIPTRGTWYSSLEGLPLVLRDDMDDDGKDIVWNLDSVSSGWNLVANPHGWPVGLYSYGADYVKDIDEKSEIEFWRYNPKTGSPEELIDGKTTLDPYEAIWVKVNKKMKWEISADPVFWQEEEPEEYREPWQEEFPHEWEDEWYDDPNQEWLEYEESRTLPKRVLAKATTKDRWVLQAVLSDKNGKQDAWNILGAGNNPFNAEEPPESMGDHVNLSIVEGKRALAKSIKSVSDEMEWTVALSASSDRAGYLTLVGIDAVKAYGYHVYVTVDGNTTEMKDGVPLKVLLKSNAKTATVRVAPAAKMVAQNSLKGLRSARLGGKLQVSFEATGLAGTNARVDLLDMKGHVMSTVNAKTLEGTNALVLDAPKSGLYMLRVRAGSQQQAAKVMVK